MEGHGEEEWTEAYLANVESLQFWKKIQKTEKSKRNKFAFGARINWTGKESFMRERKLTLTEFVAVLTNYSLRTPDVRSSASSKLYAGMKPKIVYMLFEPLHRYGLRIRKKKSNP